MSLRCGQAWPRKFLFKRDMNISYVISMLSGMVFMIVGAAVLNPMGLVPKGSEPGPARPAWSC
ncbi:hypothetical protein [Azospirillum largimobile]